MLHEEPSAETIARALGGRREGTSWKCRCPVPGHEDKNASLAIREKDGQVLWFCHAKCPQDAVQAALEARGLWPSKSRGHANGQSHVNGSGRQQPRTERPPTIDKIYPYENELGEVLKEVVRYIPKSFRQRRKPRADDPTDTIFNGYVWKTSDVPLVPYRLPQLLEAIACNHPVFVVEGEKDVHSLAELNIVATTNCGGAGKWRSEHAAYLGNANAIVIPDNHQPGFDHADQVARSLQGIAQRVRMVELPGLPEKEDVSWWLEKGGGTVDQLWAIVDQTPEWQPKPGEGETLSSEPVHVPFKPIDLWKLIDTSEPPERVWQVDGWLPGDDVCLLGGNGGDGKTQLALQLSYCTCIGHPWLGLNVRLGPVIYLTAEESAGEINFRMRQIRKSILSPIQPKPFTLISRADAATSYLVTGQRGTVVPTLHLSELVAFVDRARPALVVLDASADLFGGDEIKRAEVRSFIAALRSAMAIPYQCCVLLLTHPSVSGMTSGRDYSGTTAWNNSARSRLSLKRPGGNADPDARTLELQKNNRGKTAEVQLRWVDGYFTTQSPSAAQDVGKLAKAKQVFMSLVQRYDDQQRTASDKPGRNYAPALFEEEPEAEGLGSDVLRRAMIALFAEKKIKVITEGYASAPRSRIVAMRDPA